MKNTPDKFGRHSFGARNGVVWLASRVADIEALLQGGA